MVGTVLGIILDDDDQRVLAGGRLGDDLGDTANRIVVVGDLPVGRIYAVDRLGEVAEMVVGEAKQGQSRRRPGSNTRQPVALPLLEPPVIGEALVETAEIRVGNGGETRVGGPHHLKLLCRRIALARDSVGPGLVVVAAEVAIEAVVADRQPLGHRRCP